MSEGVSTKYMALLAAAPAISDNCLDQNRAFIKCKQKDGNPAACLSEGEKVTACALKVRQFNRCREEQKAFEVCFAAEDVEEN
ncbi:NADH dehydrogenase ubiquinone 1 alpha subcomplex subunit 8 [Hondaea fermentalgiana]|uniref:NADH dehydrogenase ubiquinone 1 alpha subcomplex subunit 8 n=1 Tax=Hondaea fermentalgiana TaxID=2315210 RepID=A0A2R5GBI9_9STRA|nr:NADH dehydrogenase ubiquinone 1 alpha subcomplex subunit 8 [Hondaea fermentalgiana]|eukprot:GBG28352.1 NADH dehydrogenase ubiquinone 1 alpha subcomplex subunit 8 [Hondaea fermentalgiana]